MRGDNQILMIASFHDHEDHWSGKQNCVLFFILEKSKKFKKKNKRIKEQMNKRIQTVKCRSWRNILGDVLPLEAAPYLQGRVVRPCSWYLHIIIFNFYNEQNTNLLKVQGSFNIQKRIFLKKIRGIVWEEMKLSDRLGKKYIRIKRYMDKTEFGEMGRSWDEVVSFR